MSSPLQLISDEILNSAADNLKPALARALKQSLVIEDDPSAQMSSTDIAKGEGLPLAILVQYKIVLTKNDAIELIPQFTKTPLPISATKKSVNAGTYRGLFKRAAIKYSRALVFTWGEWLRMLDFTSSPDVPTNLQELIDRM